MATIFPYETECAVCGKTSPQVSAAAVESDAYPDLDTRPGGEEVRAAYTYRIQRCPHCGYCAPEIELDYPLAADAVRRADYKAILHRQSLSDLGRAFLAWARIQELNEEHNGAAWATLHAAWACDDADAPQAAALLRRQALESFKRAIRPDGSLVGFEEPGAQEIFLCDLYRRVGLFAPATQQAQAGLQKHVTSLVAATLEYELELISRRDRAAPAPGPARPVREAQRAGRDCLPARRFRKRSRPMEGSPQVRRQHPVHCCLS